jgi:hypothetical protein
MHVIIISLYSDRKLNYKQAVKIDSQNDSKFGKNKNKKDKKDKSQREKNA